jgi:hypothetical protein
MKTLRTLLLASLTSAFALAAPPAGAPAWSKAEADLRANWGKSYAGEKIETLTKNADEPVLLEKVDAAGKVVERKLKYAFKVVVKKASGPMGYEAGANYVQSGKAWKFSEIGVGAVSAVEAPGDKPAKPEVKALALGAFAEKYAEYTWSNMKIDDGELGKSGDRTWVRYEGDVDRKDGEGNTVQCRDIDFTIERRGGGAWTVDIASGGKCY